MNAATPTEPVRDPYSFLPMLPEYPAHTMKTLRLLLPFLLILTTGSVHAEFSLSDLEPGPRLGRKGAPHVARLREGYVVVWGESSTPAPLPGWIAASLVDDRGQILRSFKPVRWTQGFPLFPARIAASDDRVAVPGLCFSPSGVRSVCVTWLNVTDGSISEPQVIEEDAEHGSVAWNGRAFLLTYIRKPFTERSVRARLISADGKVGEPITLGPWYPFSAVPSVKSSGESFYVAWHSTPAISTLAVVEDGVLRSSIPLEAPTDPSGAVPSLSLNTFQGELIVVTGFGSVRQFRGLIPITPWMSLGRSRHEIFHPRAVRTASGWIIVFADGGGGGSEVRAVALGSDGRAGEAKPLGATLRSFPSFDAIESDAGFVLTWVRERHPEGMRPEKSEVLFRGFDAFSAPKQAPRLVSVGVASQTSPVAAFGGGSFLVAWSERRGEFWQIRARRLGLAGQPLGPPIDLPFSDSDQTFPAIDFNGESFLVIWSEGSLGRAGIRGARLDLSGLVLDPAGFEISGSMSLPERWDGIPPRVASLSWSGTSWIIASEEQSGIELRRLTAGGLLLEPGPVILPKIGQINRMPTIDCVMGGDCLVAWHTYLQVGCQFTCPISPDSIVAIRITADLRTLGGAPLLLTDPGSGTESGPRNLAVAWNERQRAWLIVWAGPSGRRMTAGGVLLDPPRPVFGNGVFPSPIEEENGWRILWRERTFQSLGVFAGSTATGFQGSDSLRKEQIAPPSDAALETFLAAGPRPLALYVQTVPELGNSHRIFSQVLDKAQPIRRRRAAARR